MSHMVLIMIMIDLFIHVGWYKDNTAAMNNDGKNDKDITLKCCDPCHMVIVVFCYKKQQISECNYLL
jgi:hypothetical protein